MSKKGKKRKRGGSSRPNQDQTKRSAKDNKSDKSENPQQENTDFQDDSSISSLDSVEMAMSKKMPPIVLTDKKLNVANTINDIKKFDNEAKFHCTKEGLKVILDSEASYNQLKASLEKSGNVSFYTYTLKQDKQKHLVLKGLPRIADCDTVKQEIEKYDFKVTRCIEMKKRLEQQNTPPFYLVTFEKGTEINQVRKINYILNVKIRWENYKNSRKVTQCFRCQEFGHGMTNCHNKPKCLNCAENHLVKECKKTEKDKPKCANCSQEHKANSTNCLAYVNRIKEIEKKRKPNQTKSYQIQKQDFPLLKPRFANQETVENTSQHSSPYRDKLQNNSVSEFAEATKMIKEINEIFKISDMLKILKKLKTNLANCTNNQEKLMVLLECFENGE